jgi:FtsZ-interacting cell division protein ZipA
MSLTVALSILGAALLVALLVHGWWSARRASPRQADAPALTSQRVEPAFSEVLNAATAETAAAANGAPRRRGARPGWTP